MRKSYLYQVMALTAVVGLTACSSNSSYPVKKPTTTPTISGAVNYGSGAVHATNAQAAENAKWLTEQNKVSTDADGKLVLASADFNGSSQGDSGYDAGMNANKDGSLNKPALSAVKGYEGANNAVYLRDPAVAGFSYQTFGQVFDGSGQSQGYVSVGQSTSLADTATVNATYQGVAMGTYDKRSEVVSDMTAKLNWGANAKTLSVTTTNSHIATDNIMNAKGYTGISKDARFDFTENMTWDSNKKAFASKDALGYTYGANAEEIGGTFSKNIGGKAYEGAFGGTKQ